MSRWEENIRKVIPYTPGEQPNQPDMIKLNTNENPYPPAPGVEKALREMDTDTMRLYPDPTAGELVHAIAKNYGLKDEQVFVGVGSDDVLAMSFLTFFNSQKPVLFPDITYSFYDVWADLFRIPYERPALDENFHIRTEDYFRENGGIVFPNPNAPTGVEMPLEKVEDIMKITIIGAGSIGGAIAKGLAKGNMFKASDITCTAQSQATLDKMKAANPDFVLSLNNIEAVKGADIIVIAVKPWRTWGRIT